MQFGNGKDHSPVERQVVSAGPLKPNPGEQLNVARPPTSLLMSATFKCTGKTPPTSPHSMPKISIKLPRNKLIYVTRLLSQIGNGLLQFPEGKHVTSDVPIRALPFSQ